MTIVSDQVLSCQCGKSGLTVSEKASILGRFVCHCKICQSVYKAPSADFVILNAEHVGLNPDACLTFTRHRLPPALKRGVCMACNTPTVAFLRLFPFLELAFIPSNRFENQNILPDISAHIFYQSRQNDINDKHPKIEGYWNSELAVSHQVLKSFLN